MIKRKRTDTAGFTLIETMVVVVLTGLIAVGLYQMLYAGRRSHDINQHQVEMQQNARIAVSSLTDEFRHVSYGKDPTQPSISYASRESLVFVADIMTEVPGAEVISYYLDSNGDVDTPNPTDTRLIKEVADSAGNVLFMIPQSYGIASNGLNLTYFNGSGTSLPSPVANPELIGEMGIEITATESSRWKQQPYSTLMLGATVYPRNLPLTPARSRPATPICYNPVYPNCASATLQWETPTTNTDGTELPLADISHFNLFFGENAADLDIFARLARTLNEWTISDLGCGTYYVAVSCVSRNGVESYKCRREISVTGDVAPKAPADLSTSDSLGIQVTWPAVTEFEDDAPITVPVAYYVYRDIVSGFIPDETNLIATVSTTSYYDGLPNDCGEYYYQVCAKACCEFGDPSPEAVAYRPSSPQCPTNLAGEPGIGVGQIHLTWAHPTHRADLTPLLMEEIAGTWIYCDTIPGSTDLFAAAAGGATAMTLTDLSNCATYYIHARTVDTCGHPSDSQCFANEIVVSTSSPCDPAIPQEPAWLTLEPMDDKIDLTWPANQSDCDLHGYRIYYGTASGFYDGTDADEGNSPITVLVNEVTYGGNCFKTLTGFEDCQTIYTAVAAIDLCDTPNVSPLSPEAYGTTSCSPCLIQTGCPTWVAAAAEGYKDLHLEIYTESGGDETLAKLIPNWSTPAQVLQVLYGRPLVQIWNADGTAGEDGAVGPQASGSVLDLDDVLIPDWTSRADGEPLALVFDQNVADVGFDLEFKDARGAVCTADGMNRAATSFDDFDDGDTNGWINWSGSWSVENGEAVQSDPIDRCVLVGSAFFLDTTIECKVKNLDGTAAFVVFRATDDRNYYVLGIRPDPNTIVFASFKNGTFREEAVASALIDTGRWYNLKVSVSGERMAAYLDCELVLEHTDALMSPFGQIGIRTFNAIARFDDVRCRNVAQLP